MKRNLIANTKADSLRAAQEPHHEWSLAILNPICVRCGLKKDIISVKTSCIAARAAHSKQSEPEPQVEHMVQRFLTWRLPEDFNPDNGISFKPTFNDHFPEPMKCNPVGTNLFDYTQAKAMVRHMLEW